MSQYQPPYQPQYQQPQYPQQWGQFTPAAKTDGAAVTVLVLALGSLVFWIMPAIVALILAPYAKKRVMHGGDAVKGLGVIRAGQIIAAASLLIGAGLLCLISLA